MHPLLSSGRRLALYLFVFLQAGVLLAEILVRTASTPRAAAYALVLPPTLAYAFACLASWYLCRGLPLLSTAVPRLLFAHGMAGILSAGLFYALVQAGATLTGDAIADAEGLGRWLGTPSLPSTVLMRQQAALLLVFGFLLYSMVAAVHYLSIALEGRRRAESRAYELQLSARESELRALKAQVDPHFLFNSLNAIAALTVPEPKRARSMCLSLASFLRDSLRHAATRAIPLREEIALVEKYLSIERQRFSERLVTEIDVDEAAADQPVPPLLIQPLVENAIKHGIAHVLDGGTVAVRVTRSSTSVAITVVNPADADRPRRTPGAGIGLANVGRRLQAVYGDAASFETRNEGDRFVARVELPLADDSESAA